MRVRVTVIHGPNLNLLGRREPAIYGSQTLDAINAMLAQAGSRLGAEVKCLQYDGEGEIIRAVHQAAEEADALVINPGAYGHTSLALADALRAVNIPAIEVHLSNVWTREPFRQVLVTAAACRGLIAGLGAYGYMLALRAAVHLVRGAVPE